MGKKDLDPRNWGNGKAADLGKVDLGGPDVRPDANGPAKPAQSKAQTVLDDTKSTKERQAAMRSQVKESDNAVRQMLRDMGGTPSTDKIVVGSSKASPPKVQSKPVVPPARSSGSNGSNSSSFPKPSPVSGGSSSPAASSRPKPSPSSSKPIGGIGFGSGSAKPVTESKSVGKTTVPSKGGNTPRSTGTSKATPPSVKKGPYNGDPDPLKTMGDKIFPGLRQTYEKPSGATLRSTGNSQPDAPAAASFQKKVDAMGRGASAASKWLNTPSIPNPLNVIVGSTKKAKTSKLQKNIDKQQGPAGRGAASARAKAAQSRKK